MGADSALYSIDKMRHTLETIIHYSTEQGIIEAPLALEELLPVWPIIEVQSRVDQLIIKPWVGIDWPSQSIASALPGC